MGGGKGWGSGVWKQIAILNLLPEELAQARAESLSYPGLGICKMACCCARAESLCEGQL